MKRHGQLQRRTELHRGSELSRSAPPRRQVRLRPVNPERKAKRFREQFHSEAFVDFIHSLGCCIDGCERTDIEAAHVGRSRARGGRWWEVAPLCRTHHREQEGRTKQMNAKYGTDLEGIAAVTAQRWMERSGGSRPEDA